MLEPVFGFFVNTQLKVNCNEQICCTVLTYKKREKQTAMSDHDFTTDSSYVTRSENHTTRLQHANTREG